MAVRPIHHGILLMPNESAATPAILATAIDSLLRSERNVQDQFFRWTTHAGWRPLHP
jgi:hypothetical protein